MSTVKIFQWFGDDDIEKYRGPTFDEKNGEFFFLNEPLKLKSEEFVSDLRDCVEIIDLLKNKELMGEFVSEQKLLFYFCTKFLKLGLIGDQILFGRFYSSRTKSWRGFNAKSVNEVLVDLENAVQGNFEFYFLFGNELIDSGFADNLEQVREIQMNFHSRFAMAAGDTSVVMDIVTLVRCGARFWLSDSTGGEF